MKGKRTIRRRPRINGGINSLCGVWRNKQGRKCFTQAYKTQFVFICEDSLNPIKHGLYCIAFTGE